MKDYKLIQEDFLIKHFGITQFEANMVLSKLNSIEQEYWLMLERINEETHIGKDYANE